MTSPLPFADESTHLALAYVAALHRHGYEVARSELAAYVESPRRHRETPGFARVLGSVVERFAQLYGAQGAPDETVTDYLVRVRWAAIDATERVTLSELGSAMLKVLDEQTTDAAAPVVSVLSDSDPLAYPVVMGQIAGMSDALLVDPYLRLEQLIHVAALTDVTRVLLCTDNLKAEERTELTLGLPLLKPPRSFDVRTVPKSALHDRFVVPKTGAVLGIGTSLNSLGSGKLSVVTKLSDQAADVRAACEERWRSATPVVAPAVTAKPAPTKAIASRRKATRGRKRSARTLDS
jgi:hypothetical protein